MFEAGRLGKPGGAAAAAIGGVVFTGASGSAKALGVCVGGGDAGNVRGGNCPPVMGNALAAAGASSVGVRAIVWADAGIAIATANAMNVTTF
ncbi:MAG: hypothetical protein K2Q14_05540 [Gammaproteobacteria bacterium]|nr:hypothetical protein [Gammaproteobacteria bacterium]